MKEAKLFSRIERRQKGAGKGINYLFFESEGAYGAKTIHFTKGIPKKRTKTITDLTEYWKELEKKFYEGKNDKKNDWIAKHSKYAYATAVINLPNDLCEADRKRLAKAILGLLPQHHPAVLVEHDRSSNGSLHRHFHLQYSERKYGLQRVDKDMARTFKDDLRRTLKEQFSKFGYSVSESKRKKQIRTRPKRFLGKMKKELGATLHTGDLSRADYLGAAKKSGDSLAVAYVRQEVIEANAKRDAKMRYTERMRDWIEKTALARAMERIEKTLTGKLRNSRKWIDFQRDTERSGRDCRTSKEYYEDALEEMMQILDPKSGKRKEIL